MSNNLREQFHKQLPNSFFLSLEGVGELEHFLSSIDFLNRGESVLSLSKAGEGNMNLTLRVETNKRTFVIKQSRFWVEKYPEIEAPIERANIESLFYKTVQSNKQLLLHTPKILAHNEQSFLLIMDDLGDANDFISLYKRDNHMAETDIVALVQFLSTLHRAFDGCGSKYNIRNRAMRALNHNHIFVFPFEEANGFCLDSIEEGLQTASLRFKKNKALKSKIKKLGDVYKSDGDTLLQGDFYPGSWLQTKEGIKVIDPEFCFFGTPEFDLGVFIAHLMMAQQPRAAIETILNNYQCRLNNALLAQFVGIEILRRLIGLAQLPLSLSLEEKILLMDKAYSMIENEKVNY